MNSGPRELTPAQHAAIRRQIATIPLYVWLVFGWTIFFLHLPSAFGDPQAHLFRDFAHFYTQGAVANEHNAFALYDLDAQGAITDRVVPVKGVGHYPPVYGPQVAIFFAPLARLPYKVAMYLWLGLTVAIYLACGYLVWRVCPRLEHQGWVTALLLVGAPALQFELSFAQVAAIPLAIVTAAFFALRAKRSFLAGLAVGMLVFKPPLGIAAAFVFLFAGEWTIVAGAIVGALAQLAIGCVYWGPGILLGYVAALRKIPDVAAGMEPLKEHMHSWRSFFELAGLSGQPALAAYGVASLLTLIVALVCWRGRGPLAVRFAILLIATVLVDPHLYVYDLLILLPAGIVLWDWAIGQTPQRKIILALLGLCYASPLLGMMAPTLHFQPSVVFSAMLGLVLAGIVRRLSAVVSKNEN